MGTIKTSFKHLDQGDLVWMVDPNSVDLKPLSASIKEVKGDPRRARHVLITYYKMGTFEVEQRAKELVNSKNPLVAENIDFRDLPTVTVSVPFDSSVVVLATDPPMPLAISELELTKWMNR